MNFIKKKKLITLTAVHPSARFGELTIKDQIVKQFKEKPQLQKGWINGGFFVVDPGFFKLIGNKNVMLERLPIQKQLNQKICQHINIPIFGFVWTQCEIKMF